VSQILTLNNYTIQTDICSQSVFGLISSRQKLCTSFTTHDIYSAFNADSSCAGIVQQNVHLA